MTTSRYMKLIGICAIGIALVMEKDSLVEAFPMFVSDAAVQEGTLVTVRLQITPEENLGERYDDIEQFIQGQHTIPESIESQVTGMHAGDIKTSPLSVEEGVGPRDEEKVQLVPTSELPSDLQEGDTLADEEGRYATVILIQPELTLIDFNHPWAGQSLLITVQVVTIENPDEGNNTETDSALLPQTIMSGPNRHPAGLVSL